MAPAKRAPTTVYLEPKLARAVKVKAAVSGKSVSDLANQAFQRLLSDDERALRLIRERRKEPLRPYEEVLAELRRDGLL